MAESRPARINGTPSSATFVARRCACRRRTNAPLILALLSRSAFQNSAMRRNGQNMRGREVPGRSRRRTGFVTSRPEISSVTIQAPRARASRAAPGPRARTVTTSSTVSASIASTRKPPWRANPSRARFPRWWFSILDGRVGGAPSTLTGAELDEYNVPFSSLAFVGFVLVVTTMSMVGSNKTIQPETRRACARRSSSPECSTSQPECPCASRWTTRTC